MHRRDLLRSAPFAAVAAASATLAPTAAKAAAPRTKITDIKIAKVKLVKHLGIYTNTFHTPDRPSQVDVGNFEITEIYTDQGVTGFGPGTTPQALRTAKEYLVGKDPFDVVDHARYLNIQGRAGNEIEMAIWDTCGKIAGQPLWKLWGGGKSRVMPYGATLGLGDGPEERGRQAGRVKADGFKAVKMRASFPTMKEDIQLMTGARKAIGDDTYLLVDGNKAGPYGGSFLVSIWDYQRALQTAMEFEKLGTWWLEEPLGRFDYAGLHELNQACSTMRLAGGEATTLKEEFLAYAQNGCYDVWNLDVGPLGVTLFRQMMNLGFAFGRRVVPHASGLIGTICHMHLAAIAPQPVWGNMDKDGPHFELDHNPPVTDFKQIWSIFTNAPKLDADGYMNVPTEPGLGVTIPPDMITRT